MISRTKIISIFLTSTLILPLTLSTSSFATTGATSMTLSVTSGSLTINTPSAMDFGTAIGAMTVTAEMGIVTVTDTRGAGNGWTASVISTALTPATGPTIAASLIGYKAGSIVHTNISSSVAHDQTNLEGVVDVVTAIASSWPNTATWTPSISISVPVGLASGTYVGTITHSVA